MNICMGDLQHPVSVEEEVGTPNQTGGFTRTWVPYTTIFCKVTQKGGGEPQQQDRLTNTKPTEFITRWRADIIETMRLVFRGKQYNIRSLDNLEFRNEWLIIKAEAGIPN